MEMLRLSNLTPFGNKPPLPYSLAPSSLAGITQHKILAFRKLTDYSVLQPNLPAHWNFKALPISLPPPLPNPPPSCIFACLTMENGATAQASEHISFSSQKSTRKIDISTLFCMVIYCLLIVVLLYFCPS